VAAVLLALLLSFIVRVALTIVLIAGAPIALMFHALPHTDGIARWWWRTFAALLAIQLVQSLTLVVGLRVLLTPGGLGLFGLPTDTGFITLLVVLALLYILFKIPFWLLAAARIGHGRTLLSSLVRGFVAYKTIGLLTGRNHPSGHGDSSRSGGNGGGNSAGGGGGGPGPRPQPHDPYTRARTRTSAGRQLMLPLEGVARRGPGHRPATSGPGVRSSRRGARQLALPPTGGESPQNRPVLGPGGQSQLPRVTREPATRHPTGGAAALLGRPVPGRGRRGHPERPVDPFQGNRPLRSGQYPLPLEGLTSRPRATPAPAPASVTRRGAPPSPPAPSPAARARGGRPSPLPVNPPVRSPDRRLIPAAGQPGRTVATPPQDPAQEPGRSAVPPQGQPRPAPGPRPGRRHRRGAGPTDAGERNAHQHDAHQHEPDHHSRPAPPSGDDPL
jgi:hypothetical protein